MELNTLSYIIGGLALLIGIVAGKFIFAKDTKRKLDEAEHQAKKTLSDAQTNAENLKKEKLLEAKEKFVQLKAEHDKEVMERNRKINEGESRIRQKEQSVNQKIDQLEKQVKENDAIKDNLNRQIEVVNMKRTELEKHQEEHIRRLEKIAGLTAEEAKSQLVESLKHEAHTQALAMQQEIIDDLRDNPLVTIHQYAEQNHAFARVGGMHFDKPAYLMAHERSIAALKREIGPNFDLSALWDEHVRHEFDTRDVAATMATMSDAFSRS